MVISISSILLLLFFHSKIRIQTPAEKVFVMLQAAVGQHYFSDVQLRQQMSNMIDDASQILSAVEQYAKEGSGHGQVAKVCYLGGLFIRVSGLKMTAS